MSTTETENERGEMTIDHKERESSHLKTFIINLTAILGICGGATGAALYWNEITKYLGTKASDIRGQFACEEVIKQSENRVICIIKGGKAPDGSTKIGSYEVASWRRWWDDKIVVIRNGKVIFEGTRGELAGKNTSCGFTVPVTWDVWRGEKSMRDKIDECLGEVTSNK